jgi:hypothetical protein
MAYKATELLTDTTRKHNWYHDVESAFWLSLLTCKDEWLKGLEEASSERAIGLQRISLVSGEQW